MKQIIYSSRANNPSPSMIAIGDVVSMLDELVDPRRTIIITDHNLSKHYAEVINHFPKIVIGTGETIKNLSTVEYIHRELLKLNADRGSFIVGFGGGIVTDITGFVASTYMRGVRFGFVATSLLAQVDASVGGKNGVNLDGFKNIIGTFNQPDFVLCDTSTLGTLPQRELRAGLAEALKSGIIGDPELFEIFTKNDFKTISSSQILLTEIVSRCVKLKAEIVSRDEREAGDRKLLNLGHTFGHAIEKLSSRYIHGEAVAIGMAIIAKISKHESSLSPTEYSAIVEALARLGLPTEASDIPFEEIIQAAKSDKKRSGQQIDLILIDRIGKCSIATRPIEELIKLRIDEK